MTLEKQRKSHITGEITDIENNYSAIETRNRPSTVEYSDIFSIYFQISAKGKKQVL